MPLSPDTSALSTVPAWYRAGAASTRPATAWPSDPSSPTRDPGTIATWALPSNPAHKVELPNAHSRGEEKFKAAFLTEA